MKTWLIIVSEIPVGFTPVPNEDNFRSWAEKQDFSLNTLFPSLNFKEVFCLDLSVSSTWLGNASEYNDIDTFNYKINTLQKEKPNSLLAWRL